MKKASSKKGKATLKWQKNKYVTGYKIYKAKKKNGKYKLVANIKKASKAKWTSKKQKRGRKVFYKMRPYTKISDKKGEKGKDQVSREAKQTKEVYNY